MSEPDKNQTKPPAGGNAPNLPGLEIPPEPKAVDPDAGNPTKFATESDDGEPAPPETPQRPKIEPDDEPRVNFSTFKKIREADNTPTAPPEEPTPPKDSRDFTGIDEDDQPLFRKMANESFNKLRPVYIEHKELKSKAETLAKQLEELKNQKQSEHPSYYSHPQGYVLSQDYQKLAYSSNLSQQAADHWEAQLINIRRGQDWHPIDVDPKTGQLVVGESRAADVESEIQVTRNVNQSQRAAIQYQTELNNYINKFNEKQKSDVTYLKQKEEEFFPGYDKDDHPTKKLQKEVMESLPASLRDSPITTLLAKSAATNILMSQRINSLMKEIETLKGVKKDAKAAPPPSSKIKPTGGSSGRTVSYTDYLRIRGKA